MNLAQEERKTASLKRKFVLNDDGVFKAPIQTNRIVSNALVVFNKEVDKLLFLFSNLANIIIIVYF